MGELGGVLDKELLSAMVKLSGNEREAIAEVVLYLSEVDKRKLYRDEGYSSLFSYCTEGLKYSEGAAYRRISAARALKVSPELYGMLKSGQISLCAASAFSKVLTPGNKTDILSAGSGKSKVEADRIAAAYSPAKRAKRETIRAKRVKIEAENSLFNTLPKEEQNSPGQQEEARYSISLELTEEEMALIKEAKAELGVGSVKEVLIRCASKFLKQKKRKLSPLKSSRKLSAATVKVEVKPQAKSSGRYIPAAIKRAVWKRDGGQCSFVGHKGRRCSEKHRLEFDHVMPYALGGVTTAENLRLVCRGHNSLLAEKTFGKRKISLLQSANLPR